MPGVDKRAFAPVDLAVLEILGTRSTFLPGALNLGLLEFVGALFFNSVPFPAAVPVFLGAILMVRPWGSRA
jgi:hypothetical protein